jgi:acetyl-CoA acyltransferase
MSLNVYVLGLSIYPAEVSISDLRLEEMVYKNTRAALDDAGVSRQELDNVVIAASDEFDGRSISSMLMATPAGAYLKDEIKVTDSGAMALPLAAARLATGDFHLGVVASWCKSTKTDPEGFMRQKFEPVYTRPLGLNLGVTDGLFAQAVSERWGIEQSEINQRVINSYKRAAKNPRSVSRDNPRADEIANSDWVSAPLKAGQRAPMTDGAVSIVLASEQWVKRHPDNKPIAKLTGVGWSTDSYALDKERLCAMKSAKNAWDSALEQAGISSAIDANVVEIESQNGFYEAAFARTFGLESHSGLSPSGGAFSQNPYFCTGLVNMSEAVLQVAGRAGPVQVEGAQRSIAHGCYGFGQQGNVVAVFESVEK